MNNYINMYKDTLELRSDELGLDLIKMINCVKLDSVLHSYNLVSTLVTTILTLV
jgi:hypothetical protein